MIKTEVKSYKDYGNVLSVSNGIIEAYITVDVGPRIIKFGFKDGINVMNDNRNVTEPKCDAEFENFFGKGKQWEILGGHRIWTSPESYPECYYPDTDPVEYEITESGAIFTPKAETENGFQKQLEIKMDPDDANMQVVMRVKNISTKSKKFSVWGLTVSAQNGTLIIPMNDNDTVLLHNRNISVWPYTNLSDSRVRFGKDYVTLNQNPNIEQPFKLGFDLRKEAVYYCLNDDIFRKSFAFVDNAEYPDNNCSFETYTNNGFIEVESLSPLTNVKSGDTLTLTESWSMLKKPCDVDFSDDKSIDNLLSKI